MPNKKRIEVEDLHKPPKKILICQVCEEKFRGYTAKLCEDCRDNKKSFKDFYWDKAHIYH